MNYLSSASTSTSTNASGSSSGTHAGQVEDRQTVLIDIIANLTKSLPKNDLGMPLYLYRADLFPEDFASYDHDQQERIKKACAVHLNFDEGFPTQDTGALLWDRLPFEGASDHSVFRQYLEMDQRYGYRSIHVLAKEITDQRFKMIRDAPGDYGDYGDYGEFSASPRERTQAPEKEKEHVACKLESPYDYGQPHNKHVNEYLDVDGHSNGSNGRSSAIPGSGGGSDKTDDPQHISNIVARAEAKRLEDFNRHAEQQVKLHEELLTSVLLTMRRQLVLYYWDIRARAFDMVGQAAYRRIREQRAVLLEDDHYIKLTRHVGKVMNRMDNITEDEMQSVSPENAVKMLKDLVALQRVSAGLPAAAPTIDHLPGTVEQGPGASMEAHMKNLAKQQGVSEKQVMDISALLNDEATAAQAQDLILRAMQQTRDKS